MALYLGRDKEFKEIYDHLIAARDLIVSMEKKSSEKRLFDHMRYELTQFSEQFNDEAAEGDKPYWQVFKKFIELYYTHAHHEEMYAAVKEIEHVVLFKRTAFNEIIASYFNGDCLAALNSMDNRTIKMLQQMNNENYKDYCLYIDTKEIERISEIKDVIRNKEDFCLALLSHEKWGSLLGYKPKTMERLKKEIVDNRKEREAMQNESC